MSVFERESVSQARPTTRGRSGIREQSRGLPADLNMHRCLGGPPEGGPRILTSCGWPLRLPVPCGIHTITGSYQTCALPDSGAASGASD